MSLIPKYSPKGKKLYHRRGTLTPEQQLVKDFFERYREEGIIGSDTGGLIGINKGFVVSFEKFDTSEGTFYQGYAYKKHKGRDVWIETGLYKSLEEVNRDIHTYVEAFHKNV